ncbi:MAG: hypothetical protein ABI036_09530 [Fibrobacteria bacterium]
MAVLALAAALTLAACAPHPVVPREFARYPSGVIFPGPFRSVSPDGVLFTVREEANKPRADLGFWRAAMKTRMGQAGYRVVSDSDFSMQNRSGALLQLAAPMGDQDHLYWIAFSLSPSGKKILVAEASGEMKRFLARKEDIRAAMAQTGW